MTPVEFPAPMSGQPTIVTVEHIESIERHPYYDHCVLVMLSGRRVTVGCSMVRAAELIQGVVK